MSTNHLPSQIPTAHKTHSPKWSGSPKHKPAETLEAVHHNLQRICILSSTSTSHVFSFTSFSYISHWTYSYKPHDEFFCISSAVSTDPISWMCVQKLPHLTQALVQRRRQWQSSQVDRCSTPWFAYPSSLPGLTGASPTDRSQGCRARSPLAGSWSPRNVGWPSRVPLCMPHRGQWRRSEAPRTRHHAPPPVGSGIWQGLPSRAWDR